MGPAFTSSATRAAMRGAATRGGRAGNPTGASA